jgi:hypothetical protein
LCSSYYLVIPVWRRAGDETDISDVRKNDFALNDSVISFFQGLEPIAWARAVLFQGLEAIACRLEFKERGP